MKHFWNVDRVYLWKGSLPDVTPEQMGEVLARQTPTPTPATEIDKALCGIVLGQDDDGIDVGLSDREIDAIKQAVEKYVIGEDLKFTGDPLLDDRTEAINRKLAFMRHSLWGIKDGIKGDK